MAEGLRWVRSQAVGQKVLNLFAYSCAFSVAALKGGAKQDYGRLMRRLPDLLRPGGRVMLCLNAPELDTMFMHERMREAAPELVFEQRLPNPTVYADASPERSLKVLIYRAPDLLRRTTPT